MNTPTFFFKHKWDDLLWVICDLRDLPWQSIQTFFLLCSNCTLAQAMHVACLVNCPLHPAANRGHLGCFVFIFSYHKWCCTEHSSTSLGMCVSNCLGQIPGSRNAKWKGHRVYNLTDPAMPSVRPPTEHEHGRNWAVCLSSLTSALCGSGLSGVTSPWSKLLTPTEPPRSISRLMWKVPTAI